MDIDLDRFSKLSLADQVHDDIASAIYEGRLLPGSRLPSWSDLASQLGIARGTVRVAYERLSDELLIVSSGAGGTHVVMTPPVGAQPVRDCLHRRCRGFCAVSIRRSSCSRWASPRKTNSPSRPGRASSRTRPSPPLCPRRENGS